MQITEIRHECNKDNVVYFSMFNMYKFLRSTQMSGDAIEKNSDIGIKYQGQKLKGKRHNFTWVIASDKVDIFIDRANALPVRANLVKAYVKFIVYEENQKIQQLRIEENTAVLQEENLKENFKRFLTQIQQITHEYMSKL